MKKIFLILFAASLVGCSYQWKLGKCTQWGVCKAVKDSTHIIDSTYLVPVYYDQPGDSAFISAYFECDSARNVILRNSETINGKYIRMMKEIEAGKYTVYSYLPARTDTLYKEGKTHIEYRDKIQVIPETRLTKWQKFRLDAFFPLCGCALLLLLLIAYSIYKKIKK